MMQEPHEKPRPRMLSDTQIAGLMAQTGCLVFFAVIGSVLGGIWLDRVLNTRPLFTLLLVLGSAPVTLYMLFRFAMRMVASDRKKLSSGTKGADVDHDQT